MKRMLVQRGTNHAVAAAAAAATMAAVAACLPQAAFAAENAQVVEGVMTITLQQTPAVATTPSATTSAATTTVAAASSAPVTGDPVLWLIAGVIALLVAAVFVFMRMRAAQTTSSVAPSVAHAKHADGCGNAISAKSALAAMVAALLAACLCFGMYFAKSTAFAEGLLSGVTATSSVTVDERGNVVSSDIAIANASGEGVILAKVTAPSELSGWSANIETDQVIKAAEQATGEWDGKTIPAAVLSKLKENGGTLELRFEVSVTSTNLDFEEISVSATDTTYDGMQIKPAVASDEYVEGADYEVTYGENANAGMGVVTVTGKGNYAGQKTYEFKIAPATLTVTTPNAQKQYDGAALTSAGSIEGFVNGETAEFATTGSQTGVGSSNNSYAISWNGTAKQANYIISETVGTLEVTANTAKIDVTAGSAEKTYDGSALAFGEVAVAGLPEGFTYSATTAGSQTDAGTSANTVAEFAILDPDGKNVTEYFANIEKHAGVLRVSKREVTVRYDGNVSVVDKVYDGTTKAELSGTAVLEGLVAGEDLGVTQDANFDFPSAGSCMVYVSNVQLTGATAENYEIQNVVAGRLVGNILPIEAELEWDGLSVTYDGQPHAPTAKVANAVAGETVTATVDGAQTNAGTYTATATGLSDTNYLLPAYAATAEFTIKKANPTPSATLEGSYTIAVGDKLQTIDLPTCTNGTYTWETPTKTYSEGTHQASVIFTPNDQDNYNVLAFTVSVTEKQKTAFAVYSADDNSLYLYKRATVPSEGSTFEGKKVTKTYTGIESDHSRPFDGCQNLVESVKVVDEGIKPMQTSYWFQGFSEVTSIDLTGLDASSVTEMWGMFNHCGELEILTLSDSFNTSKVVSMESMFSGCYSLASLDLPDSFDTSSVADMSCMFEFCHSLQLDCSKWKVSTSCKHTDFNYLAYGVIEPNWE